MAPRGKNTDDTPTLMRITKPETEGEVKPFIVRHFIIFSVLAPVLQFLPSLTPQ